MNSGRQRAGTAPTVQIPIGIYASSTDLQQSGSTGQCSLTALEPMLISLALSNEAIPLVCAIVRGITKDIYKSHFNCQTWDN